MAEDNKNQHIVPQAYLKWFAQKKKKGNYYVKVTSKFNDKPFKKSIREVGYKKNYYSVSKREDNKYWEKYFSQNIEPLYGDPLSNIVAKIMLTSNNYKVLTREDKKILSKLIVFQLLRVPKFLNRQLNKADFISNESQKELLSAFGQQLNDRSKKELLNVKMSQDEAKDIALETISNTKLLEIVSDILIEKIWCVYLNKISTTFVTSDNPVIMYNYVSKKVSYTDNGIGRNDTLIYFPLTSHILIQLIPDISLTQACKSVDGILQHVTDIKFINSVNGFQKRNSDEIYQVPKK